MKKQYILFDLDGTLTDPKEGIIKGAIYALNHFGIEVDDPDSLMSFIGPPLSYSFQNFYGFSEEDSVTAIAKYREYYSEIGIWECLMFEGIPKLLANLKQAGKVVFLATSKPEPFAIRILEKYGIMQYFDFVAGAPLDNTECGTKQQVIERAIGMAGITDVSDVVMVGDRKFDVEGALPLGIETIGVTFGYGSKEELETAGAVCTVRNVQQLEDVLLDRKSPLTTLCYMEQDGKYLMMHRVKKEKDINKDKWIGIGGHFEPNESPEDCLLREVLEETGLELTSWRFRGIVTFISDDYQTEYMHLYTADGFAGHMTENCSEGNLEWVDKSEVYNLPLWEGDKIFFRLLEERSDFFSLKLTYEKGELTEAVLDGKTLVL